MSQLVTQHLEVWTSAIKRKSSAGRGSSNKIELYGIKKLRELILELAVRGLLVPQDPNDEPASELLKKIAAEKARLVKEGKIKKEKPLLPIKDAEKLFAIPQGWLWVRLSNLCELENGDRSKNYPNKSLLVDSGVPFVNAGHLQNGRINSSEMTFISEERFNLLSGGKFSDGDILFCLRGSLGKSAIVDGFPRGAIASSLVIVRLIGESDRFYFHNFFDSPLSYKQIQKYDNGTAQPNLSAADLGKFLIPLPPLAEQNRIVAKVDELMALCDQLEQQTEASLNAHQTLVENLLNALVVAADHAQFASAWQRISTHFDTLFTTEQSIDLLKQAILQLAVMGKLVPQDPNDEPASELLKKIAAEKARLVKEGKIKKEKPLPPITEEEKPFALPEGWEWSRFEGLIEPELPISYGVLVPGPDIENGVPFVRIEDLCIDAPSPLPAKKIAQEVDEQYSRTKLMGGEILMGIVGSIGKLGIAPESWRGANIARAVCRIAPTRLLHKDYIVKILQSKFMQSSFIGDTRTLAQPTLNIGFIRSTLTPLPPLAEQHRIVAKVDELMALCEQLKTQLNHAQTTQLQLADAITEQALLA